MADLFKRAPPAPTPPPAAIAPPTPAQQHQATSSHLDEPHSGPSDLVCPQGEMCGTLVPDTGTGSHAQT